MPRARGCLPLGVPRHPTEESYRPLQWRAAILTFGAYTLVHCARNALSGCKSTLKDVWTSGPEKIFDSVDEANDFLGNLDMAFMFSYAAGLIVLSELGDRLDLRLVLTVCMTASSFATALFGLGHYFGVHNEWYYGVMWASNGLLQAACWPAVVAVMGNWWGKGVRGAALGLWSGCASAGNTLGDILCGAIAGSPTLSWQGCMIICGGLLFVGAVTIFFFLVPHPRAIGMKTPAELDRDEMLARQSPRASDATDEAESSGEDASGAVNSKTKPSRFATPKRGKAGAEQPLLADALESPEAVNSLVRTFSGTGAYTADPNPGKGGEKVEAAGIVAACLLPGTIVFSLCYAALKSVNYTMFFWLKDFLSNRLHVDNTTADYISAAYDIASILGGFLGGLATDYIPRRTPVVVFQLILAIPMLVVFGLYCDTVASVIVVTSILGILIGGAANLVSSIFSVEIGEQAMKSGSKGALATVTSIIDGVGSLGSGVVLRVDALIEDDIPFLLAPLTALAALCLSSVFVKDMKVMWQTWRNGGASKLDGDGDAAAV